jgi:hypothetical protein
MGYEESYRSQGAIGWNCMYHAEMLVKSARERIALAEDDDDKAILQEYIDDVTNLTRNAVTNLALAKKQRELGLDAAEISAELDALFAPPALPEPEPQPSLDLTLAEDADDLTIAVANGLRRSGVPV